MSASGGIRFQIDGVPSATPGPGIPITDRAFQYGDGLFETMRVRQARVRYLDAHFDRLHAGLDRLGIDGVDLDVLGRELESMTVGVEDGVLKLLISRGDGPRGYRPPENAHPRRVLSLHAVPAGGRDTIAVRWCRTPLARNPRLAGLKHLNRLEQVLAQAEWQDPAIAEGLMLDTEGELVGGTSSNVFAVIDSRLCTPDLRFAGVAGVMRGEVLRAAQAVGLAVEVGPMHPGELARASEMFVTNAVTGIRSVVRLDDCTWSSGPASAALGRELGLD
jgi:4-amino-4-deoxychorismate lyase